LTVVNFVESDYGGIAGFNERYENPEKMKILGTIRKRYGL
jgi:hypothetical protein